MSIGVSVSFSMSMTAKRNDSMVTIEQKASTVAAQMARDIRSAHAISLPGTAVDQIVLQENDGNGGYTYVEWTYDTSAQTVTRYTGSASTGPFTVSSPKATKVTNGATGIFTYYNVSGGSINGSTNTSIVNCTARIGVQLNVATSTIGVNTFQANEDVALTDQVQIISAPGNGQC